MCRVRNTHNTAPWTTAYVCITIDESCLDENGRFVDKPMTVRMVQWQPFCVMKPFDPKTPVCAACKRTNRTRSFCRERHKHRQLPWCTVYVLLSTLEVADPSTVVAGASQKLEEEDDANGETKPEAESPVIVVAEEQQNDTKLKIEFPGADTGTGTGIGASETDTINSDPGNHGDDINDINENRTFLAKVSSRSTTIHWLELAEYDSSEAAPFPGSMPVDAPQAYHVAMSQIPSHAIDPNLAPPQQYYQPNMNYAAQQHQNALKSRQQYFFQLQQQQQQQHQQYALPPGAPQGHWQQAPYPISVPVQVQGDPIAASGATAGEAAAAQQRRGLPGSPDEMQHPFPHHPPQHWAAMYYQGPPPPPPLQYQPPPQDGAIQTVSEGEIEALDVAESQNERFHTPPESTNGDTDSPDDKRQRVV